jgi:hypothetical protein
MFTLIRMLSGRQIMLQQLPPFAVAWLIAELFYKFKSFSLECAAFIATWYVLDAMVQFAIRLVAPNQEATGTDR